MMITYLLLYILLYMHLVIQLVENELPTYNYAEKKTHGNDAIT